MHSKAEEMYSVIAAKEHSEAKLYVLQERIFQCKPKDTSC